MLNRLSKNLNHIDINKLHLEDENEEIEEIISHQRKIRESLILGSGFSPDNTLNNFNANEKSLEWLNFFFHDPEIKDLYIHHNRTKSIITLQALYYLNVFKNLYTTKYRLGRTRKGDTGDNLPLIQMKNTLSNINLLNNNQYSSNQLLVQTSTKGFERADRIHNYFKIGLIGCGDIGSFLLKNLIAIKDSSIMQYKILVSTRRPTMVDYEILNLVDEEIEICLDNERVFQECNVIFLCVQPHQLDLLLSEISQTFKEKIEKTKKKKNMIFPLIISTLAAVHLDRLKNLFPPEVNIQRTYIDPKIMKKFSENNFYKENFGSEGNTNKNLDNEMMTNFLNFNYDKDSVTNFMNTNQSKLQGTKRLDSLDSERDLKHYHLKKEKEQDRIIANKEIVKYTEESLLHLLEMLNKKEVIGSSEIFSNSNNIIFIQNLLISFHKEFYRMRRKSQEEVIVNTNRKYDIVTEENYSNELIKVILGDTENEKFEQYGKNIDEFIQNYKEEVVEGWKENYMNIIRNIYKGIE